MIPVMIGIAAATALVQYMNSEEGRRLSAEEREELKRQIDAIQKPNFDYSKFDPKLLKVVGTYNPEIADFVQEANPNLIKADSADAKLGRDAQRQALNRLTNLSKEGTDELTELERTSAMNDAAKRSRGSVGAVSENFAQRGQAGGAKELLAQMFNAQQQNEQQADVGAKFAIEAQRRKLQSLMDAAQLGGRIRQEDVDVESRNNDILNSFNQRFAARKQDWANNRASTLNEAERLNLSVAQSVADRNVSQNNDAFKYNQQTHNALQEKEYQNELDKIRIQSGVTNMARSDINSETAAKNSAISGAGGMAMQGYDYYRSDSKPQSNSYSMRDEEEDDAGNPLKRTYRN
jgi:hypothetical protein